MELRLSNNTLIENLIRFTVFLFPIAIYLPMIFTNILTILLSLFLVLNYKRIKVTDINSKYFLAGFVGLLLLHFISFIHSDAIIKEVYHDIEKKLSFIIIPIAISCINFKANDLNKILSIFFHSGFVVSSCAFVISLYYYVREEDIKFLINQGFSTQIGFHATYLSMYLMFSLSYVFLQLRSIKNVKWTLILETILVLCYIVLLSTRIVWFVLFLSVIFGIYLLLKEKRINLKTLILSFLVISLGLILVFNYVKPLKNRLYEVFNIANEYDISEVWGGRGVRKLIWNSSIELIEKKPLVGYGSTHDIQLMLDQSYKDHGYGPLLYMMNKGKVFNPHNQYLSEFLKFGVILGSFYLIFLIIMMINFFRRRMFVGVYLIFTICAISMTETILELNKGIVFISYFLPILFFSHIGSKLTIKIGDAENEK